MWVELPRAVPKPGGLVCHKQLKTVSRVTQVKGLELQLQSGNKTHWEMWENWVVVKHS